MRVLVLGGTGAIGAHVCSRLAERGARVVSTTRRNCFSLDSNICYVKGNAHDPVFFDGLLSERWDAIVDFMFWSTLEFRERYRRLLAQTDQYVFTSSYRVYANSSTIREDSPRLLDVADDPAYLATDEYALAKARCEDLLISGELNNWTIVRPAITYDGAANRFQLGVLEAGDWLWRASNGVPVPFPAEMLKRQATMSCGRDVAEMVARLVGNAEALGEAFIVSGSDHMSWAEVAEAYRSVIPSFRVLPCGQEEFESMYDNVWQIRYDRMYDRVVDNTKVLAVTGMNPTSLSKMHEGLTRELTVAIAAGVPTFSGSGRQARLDKIAGGFPSLFPILHENKASNALKYLVRRVLV